MVNDSGVEQLSREELVALVLELQRQVDLLREENARLKRSGRRQAAPFSKEKPVPTPKRRAGRKGKGHLDAVRLRRGNPKRKSMPNLRLAAHSVAVRWRKMT